jgi:hypothetical protein
MNGSGNCDGWQQHIAMEAGSVKGQLQCNGQRDGKTIAIGNGMAAAQWTAQSTVDECRQCRSGAMGGYARWTASAITMDGGGKIVMDGSSGGGQQRHNGQQDSGVIMMGNKMVVAQWTAQREPCNRRQCKMESSGNHDGRQRSDCSRRRQQ